MKKTKLISALILSFTSVCAYAQPDSDGANSRVVSRPNTVNPYCAKIDIFSKNAEATKYAKQGTVWIEGQSNAEYFIKITNNCPWKTLAVVSVDGLNVLNGETANYQQGGYVVNSMSTVNITGWRKNSNKTAAFYFTYPEDSYVGRVGKAGNIGVIGAAFFREKESLVYMPDPGAGYRYEKPRASSESSLNAPAMRQAPVEKSLGTGYGRDIQSRVTSVEFDRNPSPFMVHQIRYETRQKLIQMGVIEIEPRAFPDQQFVPPPPARPY